MWPRRSADPPTEGDLLDIAPDVRRVVAARAKADADIEDITQEALARAWEARWRLDRRTLPGYAIVTARHLVTSQARREALQEKYAARLADPPLVAAADEDALRGEEHAALTAALRRLQEMEQDVLVQHEVAGRSAADLAGEYGTTPGAVAARLARARARLRVEYVLAFRRITPPTPRCRPVLLALSSGDRRRQRELGASEHLVECSSCAAVSQTLMTRKRSLAGLVPFVGWLWDRLRARVNTPQATAAAVAGTMVTVLVAAVALVNLPGQAERRSPQGSAAKAAPATPPPTSARSLVVDGTVVLPARLVGDLSRYAGRPAVASQVRVHSVPADEGFWIGWADQARVWVQLTGSTESPMTVRVGQLVSFAGSVVRHDGNFPDAVGVSAAEGAAQLARQRAHIVVSHARLRT
jgi:RNA polymerase sigma factor (sigma-70 family)